MSAIAAFTTFTAIAAPVFQANVDTDKLIPHKFLRKPLSAGYRNFLFYDQRFAEDGSEKDFILNREPYKHAGILLSGRNFGCGSTREGAIYALQDFGIRCVIAPSFGDIFYANCLQNGLLPVVIDDAQAEKLNEWLTVAPGAEVSVDLAAQTVSMPYGDVISFEIDAQRKEQLLKGLDDIGITQQYSTQIGQFEAAHKKRQPWLFRAQPELTDTRATLKEGVS